MLSAAAQLSSVQIYLGTAGKLPSCPHHLPWEQISIPYRVTPLRIQLSWLIREESHLQGSVSGLDFHSLSAHPSLEQGGRSTLLTVSSPVNSQGHLKLKRGILALGRHTM